MASKKVGSLEEAEARRLKAVSFLNSLGNTALANEFDNLTTEEYVAREGLKVANNNRRRKCHMPNNGGTKQDLQQALDDVEDILDSAYQVESSREDMTSAISQALDILQGEDEGEDDLDDDADSD